MNSATTSEASSKVPAQPGSYYTNKKKPRFLCLHKFRGESRFKNRWAKGQVRWSERSRYQLAGERL